MWNIVEPIETMALNVGKQKGTEIRRKPEEYVQGRLAPECIIYTHLYCSSIYLHPGIQEIGSDPISILGPLPCDPCDAVLHRSLSATGWHQTFCKRAWNSKLETHWQTDARSPSPPARHHPSPVPCRISCFTLCSSPVSCSTERPFFDIVFCMSQEVRWPSLVGISFSP